MSNTTKADNATNNSEKREKNGCCAFSAKESAEKRN